MQDKPRPNIAELLAINIKPNLSNRELASNRGAKLWRDVLAEHDLNPAQKQLLMMVCIATDDVEALRRQIDAEGLVTCSKQGSPRENPAVRTELRLRRFIVTTLNELGLLRQKQKRPVGRPAKSFCGITAEQLRKLKEDDDDE
jgi:hypothetical protein